jgi:hypothetical protein
MRRRLTVVVMLIAVVSAVAHARAHEHFRVIGTLTKCQRTEIDVKNKEGRTISIYVDKKTKITRDKKPVPQSALKVGQSVVVDAYGDDEFDLLALDIRIVPPIAADKK